MLSHVVAATRVLAACSAVLLLVTSPPSRRLIAAVRTSAASLGVATLISTSFAIAILSLQLLTSALETRTSGPNPLESSPTVRMLLSPLAQGQRVAVLLIAVSTAAALWGFLARVPRARQSARGRLTLPMWATWLALGVMSTTIAGTQLDGAASTLYLATVTSIFAIIVIVPLIDRGIAVRLLLVVFLIATAATFGALLISHDWSWTRDWPGGFIAGERLEGIFPQPNVTGVFFGLGILVVLSRRDLRRWVRFALAAPMVLLVYWSGSRGAVLLLVAGIVALFWAQGSVRRLRPLAIGCVAMTVVLPALDLGSEQGLISGRAKSWQTAFDIGTRSPLIGSGAFPLRSPLGSAEALYAHNQALQTFAETGVIGLALLGLAIWLALRPRSSAFPLGGAVLIGLMATFPYENPVRAYAPSFAASFVIVLILIGSGAEAQPKSEPAPPKRPHTARARR